MNLELFIYYGVPTLIFMLLFFAGKRTLKRASKEREKNFEAILCLQVNKERAQVIKTLNKEAQGDPFWIEIKDKYVGIDDVGYFEKKDMIFQKA